MNVKELVLAEIRSRKIRLWLFPYYKENDGPNAERLQALSDDLAADGIHANRGEILAALRELQDHALGRLEKKRKASKFPSIECIELRVFGWRGSCFDIANATSLSSTIGRTEMTDNVLKLFHVDSSITANIFCENLVKSLNVDTLRLVYKGQSITCEDHRSLHDIVQCDQHGKPYRHNPDQKVSMLCLAHQITDGESPDRTLIASIRQAAAALGSGVAFDITDQHGKHVSMLPSDRLAFLTALGLHRLGRRRMETNVPSALVFLMEADYEWDNISPLWKNSADNYGLLQLDIAWVYLKLESIDNLHDVVRRLEVAEKSLRKQVDSNFVTLALVQAEMGNAVPPLSSVFCRLFLLQGVAYRFSHDYEKSKERFLWAYDLCNSLRRVSTSEQVDALSKALGVTQFQAISALRKTNGNPDQAASLIETENAERELQSLRRKQQNELGLCQNKIDFVDIDLVHSVGEILGFVGLNPQTGTKNMDYDFLVVAGLLRLSNNNVERAIEIFQNAQHLPRVVLELVADLDKTLEAEGLVKRKTQRKTFAKTDELALATLLSMGVDESRAKRALQESQNDIEKAQEMLLRPEQGSENNYDFGIDAINSSNDARSPLEERCSATIEENRATKLREEAEELLKAELGEALNERDLEQEYFGSTLDEEWLFIKRFADLDIGGEAASV